MKYTLRESKEPGWWVVTDTENLVVLKFQEHKFNETQKVTMLEDSNLSALQLARMKREIGDWVAAHHIDRHSNRVPQSPNRVSTAQIGTQNEGV